jgi:hypothetical protein
MFNSILINKIFENCLVKDGEKVDSNLIAECDAQNIKFHQLKLKNYQSQIKYLYDSMIAQFESIDPDIDTENNIDDSHYAKYPRQIIKLFLLQTTIDQIKVLEELDKIEL